MKINLKLKHLIIAAVLIGTVAVLAAAGGFTGFSRIVLGTSRTDPGTTEDIILQNDEYITNSTNGTIGFGAANLSTTGTITASNVSSITTILTLQTGAGTDNDSTIIDPSTALYRIAIRANGSNLFGIDSTSIIYLKNGETIRNTTNGAISITGALNFAIADGTPVISVGLLGGAGTSTSALQTLGAAGGKAFSFYVGSTSTTASDEVYGFYLNANYGTSGSSAAPSGDAIRGRAWLVGDASGGTALTGGAFTVELAATTASNTGLTVGLRGNLVLPSGTMTNSGTYYGTMAEIYLGGNAVNTTAYTEISPLNVSISGTAPTAASQLANMYLMTFDLPANMVTSDATAVCTGGAGDTCDAKMKININGTDYWVMLSTDDE